MQENFNVNLHCSRRGNLIYNGGFEEGLEGWKVNEGVDRVYAPEEPSHQGLAAARLGFSSPYAWLYQDVRKVCAGYYYQLNCYLISGSSLGNAPLWITLRYLDRRKNDLGLAIDVMVEQFTLSDHGYTSFLNISSIPAPPGARYARIGFEIDTSDSGGHADLDDVSLVAL
jgi:hypothetical protein